MKTTIRNSECPISYSLDIFGDKWTLLIMRDMMFYDKNSYGEFLCSDEKIASNILVDRLQTLHEEGFVVKKPSPANKSKFLYFLTEKAIDLTPVLIELIVWGAKYGPYKIPAKLKERLSANKTAAIRYYQAKMLKDRDKALRELAL